MKVLPTFKADIYIGLQEGYNGQCHSMYELYTICQKYCNEIKLGVTVTPTRFIYVDGAEEGAIVGLINYPRFPSGREEIKNKATELAKILMDNFKQERCSIVCTDETIMLEANEEKPQ